MRFNRRQFLSAMGLGTAGIAASGRHALGASEVPKRLIILSTSHGTVYEGWKMRPRGRTGEQPFHEDLTGLSSSDFSRALEPLFPHRSRLQVLDGLSMTSAELDLAGYRHEKGWLHAWTGAWVYFTGSDLFSTQPSIDQLVAAQIARPDRLPSLELGVAGGRPICHAGQAQQLPLEEDPRRAWDRLFGLASASDPLVRAQGSVLDFALEEFRQTTQRMRTIDRERLAVHFDLVRQLEQRITGLSNAACDVAGIDQLASSSEGYDMVWQAMAELSAAALSCDHTRVISLSLGDLASDDFGWGWYLSGDAHNDFAHRIAEDRQAADAMTDYTRKHAEQLAYLVDLLEAVPDPDGGSLMDHTLIVWGGELGNGWHAYDQYCALTVGGGWHFDAGQYRHWPTQGTPVEMLSASGGTVMSGLPHQHLLVDVVNAMGVETDHVGVHTLESKSGDRISVRGGLPEPG
ncbi:MAG TPA: hypothetical protein DFR83_04325 [Deltaproteobacteria bacterium]|nr:hypothetical protein [Deltaproteobacteria bacterium]